MKLNFVFKLLFAIAILVTSSSTSSELLAQVSKSELRGKTYGKVAAERDAVNLSLNLGNNNRPEAKLKIKITIIIIIHKEKSIAGGNNSGGEIVSVIKLREGYDASALILPEEAALVEINNGVVKHIKGYGVNKKWSLKHSPASRYMSLKSLLRI